MSAALDAGVLEPAVDAAVSAQAANSIEKMLCHQMAVINYSAMRLLEQSRTPNLQPGEVARFTNAAARMMDVYRAGCLTLLKLKTHGEQRVLVELSAGQRREWRSSRRGRQAGGGVRITEGRVAGMRNEARERRRGWLKNGNPPGDFSKAPRCGAGTTKQANVVSVPAMRNRRRCRLEGGKST